MNKLISLAFIVIAAFTFFSCEEQMIPIPDRVIAAEGRVMLIEDMTGVSCVPCFGANIILDEVLELNKGSVVIYGIHGNIQTAPKSSSKYDFRYEDAIALELDMNVVGKPSAAFNRTTFSNGGRIKLNSATWQPIIDQELVKPQVAEIKMLSTFDPTTRKTRIDISVIPLEDIDGEINVHVAISESYLLDSQDSPTGTIEDYEHSHVYKKSLTGLQGDFLITDAKADETLRKSYTYTVPEEVNGEWIPENMEITAFITAKDRDGEVQQAAQIHLTE